MSAVIALFDAPYVVAAGWILLMILWETTASSTRPRETATVTQATAAIAGTVLDPSGGTMPGTQMTLTNTQTGTQLTTQTDAPGRFVFRDLQPGQYELVARIAGFMTVKNVMTLEPGARLQRTITLPLGTVEEIIRVTCSAALPVASMKRLLTNAVIGKIVHVSDSGSGQRAYAEIANDLLAIPQCHRARKRRPAGISSERNLPSASSSHGMTLARSASSTG